MKLTRTFWIAVTALLISLAPAYAQVGTDPEILGFLNGKKITMGDLEKAQGSKLLQVQYQSYLVEQKALNDLIDDELLKEEAKRENITVEALLDREVNKKVVDPTEDQLKIYYDDLNPQQSYGELRDKILDRIRQRRIEIKREAYLQQLRANANILITLAPPTADFTIGDAPRLGPADAPIHLVEFADYECPYCIRMNPEIEKLKKEYGDKLSLYYKDMPLPMHAQAEKAAEAARCAGAQDKYWPYHDLLFSNNGLGVAQLKQYAKDLKLDQDKFDKCLDSGSQKAAVDADAKEARRLGLTGTPSFFLNGRFFSGAVDYRTLRDMVEQQLSMAKVTAPPQVGK